MCDGLQLEVDPFAPSVWETADIGAYWVCWVSTVSGWFMDFVGNVELSKRGTLVFLEVVFDVVGCLIGEGFFVCL